MTTRRNTDPENPELTAEFFARAKRGVDHLPAPMREALLNSNRRHRGPQKAPTKEQVTLRLDPVILDAYRSEGPGWQGRINADLKGLVLKTRARKRSRPGVRSPKKKRPTAMV